MITLPKCRCSEKSIDGRCFTCPDCIGAAIRYWDGEGVDQHEMFEYVDTPGSVSAMGRGRGQLTPIADVLRSGSSDLPF